METRDESLEVLRDIRSMMERSGRFFSLSGLAGVYVGGYAVAGWLGLHMWMGVSPWGSGLSGLLDGGGLDGGLRWRMVWVGLGVLAVSLATGLWMAARKAAGRREPLWDASARQLLVGLMVPLAAGGLYILTLLVHGAWRLVLPASLLFYGLGLVNASRHTLVEIRSLGLAFVVTGLLASLQPRLAHAYWVFGFGVLHIVYGLWIHRRHER